MGGRCRLHAVARHVDKSFAAARENLQISSMLRPLPSLLCILLLGATLMAQTLDPLLAPIADRYNGAVGELKAARKAQMAQHEAEYARQLNAAMKLMTDEGKVAILRKELEGVAVGILASPGKPTEFPAEAIAARKTFLSAAGKVTFDFAAAKKKLDEAYLKELATVAKQAKGKNSPLTTQIAAEKRRIAKEN